MREKGNWERYTEEYLIMEIERSGSLHTIVSRLLNTCLEAKRSGADKETLNRIMSYLLIVVDNPGLVVHGENKKCFDLMMQELKVMPEEKLTIILESIPEEAKMAAFTDLTRVAGVCKEENGLQRIKSMERSVFVLKKIAQMENGVNIFKGLYLWRMKEIDGKRECFLEDLLDVLPKCTIKQDREIRIEYYREFLNKSSAMRESVRKAYQIGIYKLVDSLLLFIMEIIGKDRLVKALFGEWLLTTIENNKERRKTNFDREKTITDGHAFLVSIILAKFIEPIAGDIKRAETISIDFLSRCPEIDSTDLDTLVGKVERKEVKQEDTFLTVLVYSKMLYNQISYVPILSQYRKIYEETENCKKSLKNPHLNAVEKMLIEKMIYSLESVLEYQKIILTSSEIIKTEMNSLRFILTFMTIAAKKKEFVKSMPIILGEGMLLMIQGLSHSTLGLLLEYITTEELSKFVIEFITQNLSHEQTNINYKQLNVTVLFIYLYYVNRDYPQLLLTIVNYYVLLQKSIKNNMERMFERSRATYALNIMLKDMVSRARIKKFLEPSVADSPGENSSQSTVFLHHVISSLIATQESAFEEIKKIRMTEKMIEKAVDKDKKELMGSMESLVNMTKMHLENLTESENLLLTLMSISPNAFLVAGIAEKLASMLNSSIISLVGNQAKEMVIKSAKQCGFYPETHLLARLKMYISLNSKVFLSAVVKDNGMFKHALFEKAIQICARNRGLITMGEEAKCTLFLQSIQHLEKACATIEEEIELPDEFLDPLTFAPMTDPVILKTSQKRVDRSTAQMLLIDNAIDPFTRDPLTEDSIIEDTEFKRQIEEFMEKNKRKP